VTGFKDTVGRGKLNLHGERCRVIEVLLGKIVSVVRQEKGRDGGAHASALGTVSDSFRVAGRDCNDGDFLLRQLLRPRGREIGEEVGTGGGIVKDGPLFLRGESVGLWKKERNEYVHSCAKPRRRTQAGFRYSSNQFPASRRQVRTAA
jgi:hypothetical protein